ncbi:hypothetical protein CC86DRAFT_289492 [Ophiobolus disseminans]|uniref:Uncharacterized protein n=1 Tax=Ophiobolus disseminans TaxID=1469910 RepID=A0A6A7A4J2_9PLEO|nr:hypothetical protein CC86DRAFT_289492 [Ophiobolus disseminans]
MSRLFTLPTPLPSSSIILGQLITDPAHAETHSFNTSAKPDRHQPSIQSDHQSASSTTCSLAQPRIAFNALRYEATAQSFLHKSALQRQPLYYVTGIQTLKDPSSQHAAKIPLPMHVRRVDSASGLDNLKDAKNNETVFAVELMKVLCHVGPASEPHTVEDLEYEWSYHSLADDLQLSIGLGKVLQADELRAIAGMASDEDFTDHSWDSQDDDDEDGLGGF